MQENSLSVFGSLPLAIDAERYDRPFGNQKPYAVENGVAIIDVCGALTKSASLFEKLFFGATSYEDITDQLELATEDADVKAIMLRVNSPGGTVSGMFQTARAITSARQSKSVWAVADDMACSAAYMLASAAEKIFVNGEVGCVGSIGVIAQRVDVSKADEKAGVTLHLVHAGKKKAYGNPHTPMSADEQKLLQAEVDRMYGMFVDAVSRNRGIAAEKVRATEAGVYTGQAAVDAKLADQIGTFAEAMDALRNQADKPAKKRTKLMPGVSGDHSMTDPTAMTTEEVSVKDTNDTETTAAAEAQAVPAAETEAAVDATTTEVVATEQPAAATQTGDLTASDVTAAFADGYNAAVEIADLCAIAGKPEMAAGFLAERKSASDVRAALLAGRAKAQESTAIISHVKPATGTTAATNLEDNPIVKACEARAASAKRS